MLPTTEKPQKSQWMTAFYMIFNFLSSVGIINLNKIVFKQYDFHYPNALTGLHFVLTFLGLLACRMAGEFRQLVRTIWNTRGPFRSLVSVSFACRLSLHPSSPLTFFDLCVFSCR
jgi:hypothetical protein